MNKFFPVRMLALVASGMLAFCPRGEAQGYPFLITISASAVQVNNPVNYSIIISNQSGVVNATFYVTNTFTPTAQLLGASITAGNGTISTNANGFSFVFPLVVPNTTAQMTVQAAPTQAGPFTNTVSLAVLSLATFTTNLVVQATNAVLPQADLGVTMAGPLQAVITNDWMTYSVTATNSGPASAPNVVLTNTLPAGVLLISPAVPVLSNNMIFNLGTLPNGGSTNLQITIQPPTNGVLTLSAAIGSTNVLDTNLVNNAASLNIPVTNYLPGTLLAFTNSAQKINPQNLLEEQSILLTNIGAVDVPAVRLVVTGLTNRLFNAVGTNNAAPFVYYSAPLAAGQSATLLLQYSPRGAFPFTNGQLHAFAAPAPNWSAPLASMTGTNVPVTKIVRLANGNVLLEWASLTNRIYTVIYSDSILFTNFLKAPPVVIAPANRTQWIDYGPPATVSAPTGTPARYYLVFLNP